MLATPLSGLIAHSLSNHRWFEKGESDLLTNGGLVGGLYGIAIPYLLDIENLENWTQAKIYTASAMIGVPTGVWATSRLFRDESISQGRAHLISLGGVVGSLYAAGLTHLSGLGDVTIESGEIEKVERPRAYVLAAALGLPLGTYLGYKLTDKDEYTTGRARLIMIGAVVGALSAAESSCLPMSMGRTPNRMSWRIWLDPLREYGTHTDLHGDGAKNSLPRRTFSPKSMRVSLWNSYVSRSESG